MCGQVSFVLQRLLSTLKLRVGCSVYVLEGSGCSVFSKVHLGVLQYETLLQQSFGFRVKSSPVLRCCSAIC